MFLIKLNLKPPLNARITLPAQKTWKETMEGMARRDCQKQEIRENFLSIVIISKRGLKAINIVLIGFKNVIAYT